MKTFTKCDLVPACEVATLDELIQRAKKCRLDIKDILDVHIDETHFKEILFSGTRLGYIKYWGTDLLKGNVEFGAIPGILKLMFMH